MKGPSKLSDPPSADLKVSGGENYDLRSAGKIVTAGEGNDLQEGK